MATQVVFQTLSAKRTRIVVRANYRTSREYRHDENWRNGKNGFPLENSANA